MDSGSRSIKTVALWLLMVVGVLFASMVPVCVVHAQTPPGVSCSTVNGVYVCTDNSTGSSGSVCVTDQAGNRVCLDNGQPAPPNPGSSQPLGPGLGSVQKPGTSAPSTGWLSMLTHWVAYAINQVFTAFVGVLRDLVTFIFAAIFGVVEAAVALVGVPDFIQNNSLGSLLGQTGGVVGFFMTQLQIPAALGLVGAGYAFRLVRKFVTLFQW